MRLEDRLDGNFLDRMRWLGEEAFSTIVLGNIGQEGVDYLTARYGWINDIYMAREEDFMKGKYSNYSALAKTVGGFALGLTNMSTLGIIMFFDGLTQALNTNYRPEKNAHQGSPIMYDFPYLVNKGARWLYEKISRNNSPSPS